MINWQYLKLLWDDSPLLTLQEDINEYKNDNQELKKVVDVLTHENLTLKNKIDWEEQEETLEEYWNNKHEKGIGLYKARNKVLMDVRQFINPRDINIPTVTGKDHDTIANKALEWVEENINYTLADETDNEFWKYSWETINKKRGDCEDGAILLYNIMLKSGVPYWRIRLNAGDVAYNGSTAGHAYVTYLREKDNTWYVLDWCYWYNESVNFKKPWSKAKKYFGIWFSWNEKYVFNETEYQVIE